MSRPMQRNEERRVPLQRAGSGERVICTVRRRHERQAGDLSFTVTEYEIGRSAPVASHVVHLARARCACGEPYPCLHAKAVWRADPTMARYRPREPSPS